MKLIKKYKKLNGIIDSLNQTANNAGVDMQYREQIKSAEQSMLLLLRFMQNGISPTGDVNSQSLENFVIDIQNAVGDLA